MKYTITILSILFTLNMAAQDTLAKRYMFNLGAAYTGSFIEDVYQYQPALAYAVGFDYYWSKQVFTGFKFTTMQVEVVPEWEGFEPYVTRNNLLLFEYGISFKNEEIIFIPAIHAGVGFYYLDEFNIQSINGYGSVDLTYHDDYSVSPIIGLDSYFGYRISSVFSVGVTFGCSYVYQNWNIAVTGAGNNTTYPLDFATSQYKYAQSLITISGGIKIIWLL